MKQISKYIGLFAILPLALLVLSPNLVSYADAANVGSMDKNSHPGFNQPGKVCGDRLCSESASANAANVGSIDENSRPGFNQPGKVCGDRLCSESASAKSLKSEHKLSKSTGGVEYDALSAQFAEKTQQLSIANANGDSEKVAELQDELKDLRNQINEWKNE